MTQILVINFGSQVVHLITRRIRELGVSSEIKQFDLSSSEIKRLNPKGIILSGGPASVYEKNSPQLDRKILSLGIPVLRFGLYRKGKLTKTFQLTLHKIPFLRFFIGGLGN